MPANASYGQMEVSTLVNWLNKSFADTVYDGAPFFKWLNSKGRKKFVDGGRKLLEPLMTSGNTAVEWGTSGYDEFDLTPQAGFSAAEFPYAILRDSVVMDELTQAQNRGRSEIIDLWEAKVMQAKASLQDKMNQDVFQDGTQETGAIVGLEAIVSETGTYGGIARSGNTFWQAYVEDSSEVLDDADLLTGINTVARGGRARPDAIWTTQTLWEKLHDLMVSNVRYQDADAANLGFQTLSYAGIPVYWDPDCTSGVVYFLNSQYLKLQVLEGYDFAWTPKRQPTRQTVDAILCRWYGQMTSNNVRYQGKLSNRTAS